LVFHGLSKAPKIDGRQRNRDQSKDELLDHYDKFHGNVIHDDTKDEESNSSMDFN
jgi:hypothetical protein